MKLKKNFFQHDKQDDAFENDVLEVVRVLDVSRKTFYRKIKLGNHRVADKQASQVYNLYGDIHHHVLHPSNSARERKATACKPSIVDQSRKTKHLMKHKIGF